MGKRKRRDIDDDSSAPEMNGLQVKSEDVAILSGHTAEVFICTWSPTENLLASSSGDSTARIWSMPPDFKGGSKLKNIETILEHDKRSRSPKQNKATSSTKNLGGADQEIKKDVTTIEWSVCGGVIYQLMRFNLTFL